MSMEYCPKKPRREKQVVEGIAVSSASLSRGESVLTTHSNLGTVSVLTWNLAAVNNNPFEYWVSITDSHYTRLMVGVEKLLQDPGKNDLLVGDVFTDAMFSELKTIMIEHGVEGVAEVEAKMWKSGDLNLCNRRIISGFLKEPSLGSKRLISMPDRVTNTVSVITKKTSVFQPPPVCRPSVINNYDKDLGSMEEWWLAWKAFMFVNPLIVRTKQGSKPTLPFQMLEPIPRAKYPAVTEDEERLALPLQILCLAIFDAIMVFIMNHVSPKGAWMNVKRSIMNSLYRHKTSRQLSILERLYAGVDVLCLQEVAATFHDRFLSCPLSETHFAVLPQRMNAKRGQNSIILLRQGIYEPDSVVEVTDEIIARCPKQYNIADGDLMAITFKGSAGGLERRNVLVASFHGDTDGRSTIPVVEALDAVAREEFPGHIILLGFDANLYLQSTGNRVTLPMFMKVATPLGYMSCFGEDVDPRACRTTCNARTFLQPQLNKAISYEERVTRGESNPKDHIFFKSSQLELVADALPNPIRDNTGKMEFLEDTIFPSLDFPSDHAIVTTLLQLKTGLVTEDNSRSSIPSRTSCNSAMP